MDEALNSQHPARMGNRDPHMAPHGVFACAGEDQWVSIACANDDQWQALAEQIGGDLPTDSRFETLQLRKQNEAPLEALVSNWCSTRDRWDLTKCLQSLGIAAMPTLTSADIVHDPHLNARAFIERLPHPVVGARAHAGIPWRLQNRGNGVRRPAPCLGADTDELLERVLGYNAMQIAELRRAEVLR